MTVDTRVDEMVTGRGGIWPHWSGILGTLSALGEDEVAERARRLDLAAQEEGADPGWRCDPVPLPLVSQEFAMLEAGLIQRAELLEAILADVYGPQTLLAEGVLPPALLHANPGYERACRAESGGSGGAPRYLQAYAADLVRGPDRQWRVVADRTNGALGIGYARESRRLLAQVLPELFRSGQVRQLRPFFEAWQEALLRLAPRADGSPAVVALLTHGPRDPHWPEHLALSRDLACALVEPRDLTVRGGKLSIKTLQGLQSVDVLLRRVLGEDLDPLELQGRSGVAGLMDVARTGSLRIVNHPGAAVIEAPAFAAFMPQLARRLLNQVLLLATRPTLWLAEPGAVRTVMRAPGRWGLRAALDAGAAPIAWPAPDAGARAALEERMATAPWSLAGCSTAPPSTAPCAGPAGLVPEPVVLRLFLMHDGVRWQVMQGGLARVLRPGDAVTDALPAGAVFKDVWVMREDAGLIQGPEPVRQGPIAIRRTAVDMPSRVADDFYWLGRYVERLEAQARLGRSGLLRRARGAPLPREIAELVVLVRCLEAAGFDPSEPGTVFEEQMRGALQPHGAIGHGLAQSARLIEALRDRMTVETHGAFGHALRAARNDVAAALQSERGAGLDPLVHAMAGVQGLATTVAGVAAEGMVRGGGRLFLDLGRRIERGMVVSHVLAAVLDQPATRVDGALRLALELCDSAITYRGRYFSVVQPAPVLDLVLADTGNPRALAFQFEAASTLLEAAGDAELAGVAAGLQHGAAALVQRVVAGADPAAETVACAAALAGIGAEMAGLSDRITRRFFALLPKLQSVGLETA